MTTDPRLQGGAAPAAGTLEPFSTTLDPFVENGSTAPWARGGEADTKRRLAVGPLRLPSGMRRDPPVNPAVVRVEGLRVMVPGAGRGDVGALFNDAGALC